MPWFGAAPKKNALPAPTKLQNQKSKQIESLQSGNFNVIETIRDIEYCTTVQVAGLSLSLIITLPPNFPQDKPSVTVEPPVQHPWVNSSMRVTGCPNIENVSHTYPLHLRSDLRCQFVQFSATMQISLAEIQLFSIHSSLCTAIQAVMDEFQTHPPALVSHTPHGTSADYLPTYQESTSEMAFRGCGPPQTSNSTSEETSGGGIPDFSQIDVFQSFPDLKQKTNLELLELINEEEKILELIQQLPQICDIAADRESISCKCTQLAKDNMSQKPVIEDLKQSIRDQACVFDHHRDEFESHQEKQLSYMDQFHPSAVLNNLKVAILETEEDSDRIVEEFLDKKLDTDEFTNQFLEKRTLYHTRRAKEEKLNQMNTQQRFA